MPLESPNVTFDNLEEELNSLYKDLVLTGLDKGNRNLAIQRYNRLNALFGAVIRAGLAGA